MSYIPKETFGYPEVVGVTGEFEIADEHRQMQGSIRLKQQGRCIRTTQNDPGFTGNSQAAKVNKALLRVGGNELDGHLVAHMPGPCRLAPAFHPHVGRGCGTKVP